jgi:hypothetical protein
MHKCSFWVKAGDFNNDGKLDLVAASQLTDTVIILLGNGDGTFQPPVAYYAIRWVKCLTTGDLNRDGNADIALTGGGTISVLLGNGNGTFQAHSEIATGYSLMAIVTEDFNNDDRLDLAVSDYDANKVYVLLGNGDGTFLPKIESGTGNYPRSIAPGDFNGDGKMDLTITTSHLYFANTITILLGNGDGTFQPKVEYGVPSHAQFVTAEDFNNDGKLDIATSNYYGNNITVFIGNGDGTFQPYVSYWVGNYPYSIISQDFNSDGKPDLVVLNVQDNTVLIFLNIYGKPIANAGSDQTIETSDPSGAVVIFDGSASYDPNSKPLSYTWTWDEGYAEGVNPIVWLPFGSTVVTLTVSNGKETAKDTVNVTICNSLPPNTTVTGTTGKWDRTDVLLTFSATDNCTGVKEIHYIINGTATVISGNSASVLIRTEGINDISYYAVDNAGNSESPKNMTVKIDKTPPVLNIAATPNILWPPNRKMVDIFIGGGVSDDLSGVSSAMFTITDEYGQVQPQINDFNTSIALEAWREGADKDGRTYTITAIAADAAGNKSTASAVVIVPHDRR